MDVMTMRVTVHVPATWVERLMERGWSKTAAISRVREEVKNKTQDALDFSDLQFFDDGTPYLEAI